MDLAPIGGKDNTPLLQMEPGVFPYAIGWYSFHPRLCVYSPEGEGGVNPPNLEFDTKLSLAP